MAETTEKKTTRKKNPASGMDAHQRLMYVQGEALFELKGNPRFDIVMGILDSVIDEIAKGLADIKPEGFDGDFAHEMVHRAGILKGLKDYRFYHEQLENFYKKHRDEGDE